MSQDIGLALNPGGEHHGVVGEGGGRDAVRRNGGAEGLDHGGATHPEPGGDVRGIAGLVVQPGEDLDIGAISQPVVGEVRLPGLVRQLGLEPDVGVIPMS